jgi:hypothetical protein
VTNNQLAGIALFVFGLVDLLIIPKMMEQAWHRAKRPPNWAESLSMIVRIIGVVFLFFGISYYFYGQLE